MTNNAFALLDLPRRPWLDTELIQLHFQKRAAEAHPDRKTGNNEHFTALNRARDTALDVASRLREIMRLEGLPKPDSKRPVPSELQALFVRVSELTATFDTFLKRKQTSPGALAKALLATEEVDLQEKLQQAGMEIEAVREQLYEALKYVDGLWDTEEHKIVAAQLPPLADAFAYTTRWKRQIDERLLQLIL